MTTTASVAPARADVERPAHRDGDVLRWLAAYTASMIGDNVYYLALSWAAVRAGSPAQAGLVMTVSAVPRALLMLGGGVIADRFGPRRVVIGSDATRCAAALTVAVLFFVTDPGLWPLAALAVVFGTVDAVFIPAVGALPARVTSRGQLARVQGMRGLGARLASVVGGPLGGLGVALGGTATAFGLAALLIAVSIPLLMSVRIRELPADDRAGAVGTGELSGGGTAGVVGMGELPAEEKAGAGGRRELSGADEADAVGTGELPVGDAAGAVGMGELSVGDTAGDGRASGVGVWESSADDRAEAVDPRGPSAEDQPVAVGSRNPSGGSAEARGGTAWRDLVGGLRYIRGHRVLAPLMLAIALGDLGFVGPLNVGLALLADERGWGASGMGWTLAGFGTGAGVASLLLAVRGRLPHAGQVAAYAILAGSVAIGALAHAPGVPAAVGTAVLVGLLAGLGGALCAALLQTQSDPAYLGRVTAVASLVSLGLAPLGMPLSAAAIGAWGTGPVFVVSAVVCGLGGVVILCFGHLRRAELPR
ncbi:MFS transporter [Streptomyces asoensis]|uniref:MFS transporter n=1 Tax=Streptomyces asoensis TaxID=249586 RepID=A0A6M4WL65_9ACTN|nr:MFS transporter [Streptomyces asoensis]QJT01094.1 MFS transporter [Streptomyces asoensis]